MNVFNLIRHFACHSEGRFKWDYKLAEANQ